MDTGNEELRESIALNNGERDELKAIDAILREHEKETRCSTAGHVDRLRITLDHYRHIADRAVSESKSFRDDFVTWLRAVQLNMAIVEGGYTHAEKAARLRGFEELINNLIRQLREAEFNLSWSHWSEFPDLFDPVDRRLFERNRDLQNQNSELRKQLDELSAEIDSES